MLSLSVEEIIKRIQKGMTFEAQARDRSFRIKIKEYVPYVCTAIHDGGNFRDELKLKTLLSDYERWYEEDPFTAEFISSMPIVLAGQDSRFEYDLNRGPDEAVYDTAWGKKVWKKSLSRSEKKRSINKHNNYYRVTHALVEKLESLFDACVVYDIHSYNYKRWDREVPVFNIGTERVDQNRFDSSIKHWREQLSKMEIPNAASTAKINDVFFGRGYNLAYITEHFENTLVLATEIKKIYCDEQSAEPFPSVIRALQEEFKEAIINNAHFFARRNTNWEHKKKNKLLSSELDKDLLKIDRELFRLVKDFELLKFVNPINVEEEKKKFFESKCTVNPDFRYKPININAFEMKRKLLKLEVERVSDVNIQHLYESVINSYVDKIDLLAHLGTDRFLYNSLRYFGEPAPNDVHNANYLLHLPPIEEEELREPQLDAQDAVKLFRKAFDEYGFKGKIEVRKDIVASAMVLNQQKKVLIKKSARFRPKELRFLVHHEIGVHMVTTMNAVKQPLKIFSAGLPINTLTQEGLAVLAEYLSGNITLKRLKELGLRVIALEMMVNGADFKKTYRHLVNERGMDVEEAFYLVTRAFRGGGFTKDYLYLRGFKDVYEFYRKGNDLRPLLIGKTSLEFYHIIEEMIERGLLHHPTYLTKAFEQPQTENNNPIFDYVITGIR